MSFEYKILLDVNRDYTFTGTGLAGANISSYVKRLSWQFGLGAVYDVIGNAAYLELALDNSGGDFLIEQSTATYYGKLRRGTMVRVQMSTDGVTWTNMVTLKIQQIIPTFTFDGAHEVTLKCSDIMADFLNQDFVAPLQTDVRIDQILARLHETAAAIWPYESYYQFIGHTSIGDGKSPFDGSVWTDFETAETTLPYYGDNLDRGQGVKVQQYVKEAEQAEIFGLYYFSPRSELFESFSRYHASDTATSWNVTSSIMDAPRYTYARDLVNDFTLSYYPRSVGSAGSVLWSSDNVPFVIPNGGSKRITMRYRDPNNENATVGALVVLDMVRGTDFIANNAADGSGADATNLLTVTLIKGTASSEVIIANRRTARRDLYVTTLQLRGTPITAYNKEQVFGYNDTSVYGSGSSESEGNDRASGYENLSAVSDIEFAQAYADYKVSVFGSPQQVIEKLVIPVKPDDSATQSKVLSKTIGDTINVTDSYTGHNMDYMIVAEQHNASPQSDLHTVTYTLRPTNRGAAFILDESTYGSGDIFTF